MEAIHEQRRMPNHQLRRQRELRGWSRGQMAKELQTRFPEVAVTDKDILRWENGKRRPGPYYREKLCALFETTSDQLGLTEHVGAFDWGEAPASMPLYGRDAEIHVLTSWTYEKACRVLALVGMGGIGKTSLAVELSHNVQDSFDALFWRSLVNAPPAKRLIQDAISCFSYQQHTTFPDDTEDLITLLIRTLQERRCLLVLDNYETILQEGLNTGAYREGYQDYGRLITRIGEMDHQSRLVITSREKPPEVAMLEGDNAFTRSYQLAGLPVASGQMILHDKGLDGDQADQESLVLRYEGNPLSLKLISQFIREVFDGEIAPFLEEGEVIFHDIQAVLDQQVQRLSPLELSVMYWLAIEREAITLHHIHKGFVYPVNKRLLQEAVQSLRRRHLIETSPSGLTLQNVVMEYMTGRLIAEVCEELQTGTLALWKSHALMQAQAKEYVRESQVHLILQPIGKHLLATFGREGSETSLRGILSLLRSTDTRESSYAAGNILNLLVQLGCNLRGYDFSSLEIRQAYLQGVTLPEVDFVHSHLIGCMFTETFGSILTVAFSPDGNFVAAGTANGEVRVWKTSDRTLLHTLRGHADWVRSIDFSSNGRLLASGSHDQTIRVWEVNSGRCLYLLRDHTHRVRSVRFSPNGLLLLSGSEDGSLRLWEVETGTCVKTLLEDRNWIYTVAFSPDGRLVASGGEDGSLRLWEISTGACLKRLRGHTKCIHAVAFSPDGRLVTSGGEDGSLRLWEISTGACRKTLHAHTNWIYTVAFHPDGKTVISGGEDHFLQFWNVSTGHCTRLLRAHSNRIRSIAIDKDGTCLASGSEDQTLRLWEVSTAHCLAIVQGHNDWIRSVTFCLDGHTLASAGEGHLIRFWDIATGQCVHLLREYADRIHTVSCHPETALIACGGENPTISVWDIQSGGCVKQFQGHTGWVYALAFHPQGEILASGGHDHMVCLWYMNGEPPRQLQGHRNRVRSVAFSPDGCFLASGSEDQTVRLWDVKNGHCLAILEGHTNRIWSLAFGSDGKQLVSAGHDRTLRLWDTRTGECLQILQGHTGRIWSVAFSPDGKYIASGSEDRTVHLWDSWNGQCLNVLRGHTGWVWSVAFSSDGTALASGSDDGTLRLWEVQKGTCKLVLRSERPYEGIKISDIQGVTQAQKNTLKMLGACETSDRREKQMSRVL